jgi:hypothetical protein
MQYAPSDAPPPACPVCEDERQYVPPGGQAWLTLDELRNSSSNAWRVLEPNLYEIVTTPAFAIGQRAQLLRTPAGNILWDCIALIDGATVELINAMGGIKGIAISRALLHLHDGVEPRVRQRADPSAQSRSGMVTGDPAIKLWEGERKELLPGLTLICCGGHYPGGTVLHWAAGAGRQSALLGRYRSIQDRKTVSFMRSFRISFPCPHLWSNTS